LVDEYSEAVSDGHNVLASVCIESRGMYRATGPDELRVVGELSFSTDRPQWRRPGSTAE
jgi:hypothetical protein